MKTTGPEHFFDACAMIGKWHKRSLRFSSVDGLLTEMHQARIEKALVYHSIARLNHFRLGNEILDYEIAQHPELVPCYAWIPFTTGEMPGPRDWDRRLREEGPFAVRLFPNTHHYPLRSLQKKNIFEYAEEMRLPLFIDIDEFDYRDLWSVCSSHPKLRVVLGNAGTNCLFGLYREFRWIYEFLESFENLSLEISFLIGFRGIEDICERFGARRLLYGSRMPFLEPGSSIARLQYAEIEEADKNRIAFGNLSAMLEEVVR